MERKQAQRREPMVSVVVPTAGRSPWLRQAVESALKQSYRDVEVLVVDDSPDGIADSAWSIAWGVETGERPRLIHSGGVGGAAARNAGVQAARGEWIAFLDDDDEWMPEKLQKQMEVALDARGAFPVMSCRVRMKMPGSEYVFPRRVYNGEEPVEEYLFCRKGWARGSGFLQTSTLLVPRELMLQMPFTPGLPVHQDWDWLLRASRNPAVQLRMLDEALVVYRTEDGRKTVSRQPDWRKSLEWVRWHARWMEPKAVSWFVAVQCVWKARAARVSRRDWAEIVWAFCFEGQPTLRSAVHFAVFAVVPTGWRKRIRNRVWRAAPEQNGRQEWRLMSKPKAL